MANCIYITGSITQALKAKKLLAEHSIAVNTTKTSFEKGKTGCVHGIEFNCNYSANIKRILLGAAIPFEEISSDLPR